MEENNNNDEKAMDKIKQTAKSETKRILKKGVKSIIKFIAPALGIFLLCLLALGVMMIAVYSIMNFFNGLIGIDAEAATTSSIADETKKMVSIESNGYKLNDEYADKILKELQSKKVDTDVIDLDFTDMIDKYIEAEIQSMYPDIGRGGDVQGKVVIKRMSAETGKSKKLEYINYEDFKSKVNNGDSSVLKNFSLNPKNFELCIASSSTEIKYDYEDGKENEVSSTTTIEMKEIEYQTLIQRYATPLNYFISMHMICADKGFMEEFLKMVKDKNQIELTFVESTYKEFVQVDYEGEIKTIKYQTVIKPREEENESDSDFIGPTLPETIGPVQQTMYETIIEDEDKAEKTEINTGNVSDYSDDITQDQYLIEKVHDAGTLQVTVANTWRVQSKLDIQVNDMVKVVVQDNNVTEEVEIDESDTKVTDREYSGSYRVGEIKEITNEWTETYTISINETEAGYELTDFMKLIEGKYPKVKNNLETSPSLLFYLLEQHENTQELASVMRYVISQFNGVDYGVKELDFSQYLNSQFSSIGAGADIFLEYLHSWEETTVWQYINGKSGYNNYISKYITQDKSKYICYHDGDDTKNFGFGVCHYYSGNYNNRDHYDELGIDITKYDIGSKLDVEIVDKVERMEVDSLRKTIEKKLKKAGITLEEYQIHALIAVCYQWGPDAMNDFIPVYKQFGNTDALRQNFSHSGDKPFLTGDEGRNYEIRRANANWTLFHEGKYLAGTGEELDPNDYSAGGFLAVAQEVWHTVCTSGKFTTYGGSSIPCKGPTIDCSAYVSWVLYEYGYTYFRGWQNTSYTFYTTDWNKKFGWEEIKVGSSENPYDILQPGDIFVRYGNGTHHVTLVVEKRKGDIYCYDCGDSKNWLEKGKDGQPIDRSYFLTKTGNGKIIRVTPPE